MCLPMNLSVSLRQEAGKGIEIWLSVGSRSWLCGMLKRLGVGRPLQQHVLQEKRIRPLACLSHTLHVSSLNQLDSLFSQLGTGCQQIGLGLLQEVPWYIYANKCALIWPIPEIEFAFKTHRLRAIENLQCMIWNSKSFQQKHHIRGTIKIAVFTAKSKLLQNVRPFVLYLRMSGKP